MRAQTVGGCSGSLSGSVLWDDAPRPHSKLYLDRTASRLPRTFNTLWEKLLGATIFQKSRLTSLTNRPIQVKISTSGTHGVAKVTGGRHSSPEVQQASQNGEKTLRQTFPQYTERKGGHTVLRMGSWHKVKSRDMIPKRPKVGLDIQPPN